MEKLSKVIRIVGYLDYAVSTAVLAYGVYTQSLLYGALGCGGLVIAYLRPADRVRAVLMKKFTRTVHVPTSAVPRPTDSQGSESLLATDYLPRRRYAHLDYFVGYEIDKPKARSKALAPRDYLALLAIPPDRFRPGIKATKIVPR